MRFFEKLKMKVALAHPCWLTPLRATKYAHVVAPRRGM